MLNLRPVIPALHCERCNECRTLSQHEWNFMCCDRTEDQFAADTIGKLLSSNNKFPRWPTDECVFDIQKGKCKECSRKAFETAEIETEEGFLACSLVRTKEIHVSVLIREASKKTYFSHIATADLTEWIGGSKRGYRQLKIWWPVDYENALSHHIKIFCLSCKTPVDDWNFRVQRWHWRDLGVCEECIIKIKVEEKHLRKQKSLIEEKEKQAQREYYRTLGEKVEEKEISQRKLIRQRRAREKAAYELFELVGAFDGETK